MPSRTKTKPPTKHQRALFEAVAFGAGVHTSPLEIDEEAGIIFRVKVLGRFSRNNHGLTEAENGTDYLPCMRQAIGEYEGKKVKCNHPADRSQPGKERPVEDTFGVLRNVLLEDDENGEPAVWADLHYLTSHPMAPRVVEDVKKGLGVYGLSHNAAAKRERFDRANKRLVIEELATVRSVDLVDKPATNRTLWESEMPAPKTTNLRELLEARYGDWSKPRQLWADRLLEDDGMAPLMDAPVDAPADDGDEHDALWAGFKAAIDKLFDKYVSGDMDEKEVGKQVTEYLKAHKKLTGSDEPEEPPAKDASESEDGDDKKDKDAMESEELKQFKAEKKARELCESLGFVPTTLQVEAVAGVRGDKRQRELAESFKPKDAGNPAKPGGPKPARSAAPGTVNAPKDPKKDRPRDTLESEADRKAAVESDLATLRNG